LAQLPYPNMRSYWITRRPLFAEKVNKVVTVVVTKYHFNDKN